MTNSSEKFCLKWNDFEQNIVSSYQDLRKDSAFSDVTLVCEEDKHIEAHRIILTACSPFFNSLLKRSMQPHLMIYMRGMKTKDLMSILDFIYNGEASIYQDDLDGFLALAEELQLKGLSQENTLNHPEDLMDKSNQHTPTIIEAPESQNHYQQEYNEISESVVNNKIENQPMVQVDAGKMLVSDDSTMEDLRVKLDSMMERVYTGEFQWKCTVCGKGTKGNNLGSSRKDMRRHIETHMEGLAYHCNQCGKVSRSSNALKTHNSSYHRK